MTKPTVQNRIWSPEQIDELWNDALILSDPAKTSAALAALGMKSEVLRYEALYRFAGAAVDGWQFNKSTGLSSILYSSSVKMELEGKFNAVRLMYANRAANAVNAIKAIVGTTETNAHDTTPRLTQPIIGGTAYNVVAGSTTLNGFRAVTWNSGASSGDCAAATTKQTFVISDRIPISDVARADGGTRPLLLYRVEHDGSVNGNWAIYGNGGFATIADQTAAMRNRTIQTAAGDGAVTTIGGFMGSTTTIMECYPIVTHNVPVLSVWGVGDSITEYNAMVADGISAPGLRACLDVSTLSLPVVWANFGASSSNSLDYLNTFEAALIAGAPPPSVVITNSGSINDLGASPTARNVETMRAAAFRLLNLCQKYRIPYIIMWGTMPYASLDSTEDALRKNFNAEMQTFANAHGVQLRWIDVSAVGDGATPERFNSADLYTTDGLGLHPNEVAGENKIRVAIAAALTKIITEQLLLAS